MKSATAQKQKQKEEEERAAKAKQQAAEEEEDDDDESEDEDSEEDDDSEEEMQTQTIEKQIRDGQLRYKPKPNEQPPEKKPAKGKTTDQRLANSFSKVGQRKG